MGQYAEPFPAYSLIDPANSARGVRLLYINGQWEGEPASVEVLFLCEAPVRHKTTRQRRRQGQRVQADSTCRQAGRPARRPSLAVWSDPIISVHCVPSLSLWARLRRDFPR